MLDEKCAVKDVVLEVSFRVLHLPLFVQRTGVHTWLWPRGGPRCPQA